MKGKIPIMQAEILAEEYKQQVVIIFSIDDDGQRFNLTTYGKDKKRCKWAGKLADNIAEAITSGKIESPSWDGDNG